MPLVVTRRVWVGSLAVVLVGGCATAGSDNSSDVVDAHVSQFIDAAPFADADPATPDAMPGVPDAMPLPPDASPPDATPPPPTELGRIGYWGGKVNIHKAPDGVWMEDPDCASGADINTLNYCRKWWPATVSVTQVTVTPKVGNIWYNAGCMQAYPGDGISEYTCNPL